jgi:phosphoglycerate kinase
MSKLKLLTQINFKNKIALIRVDYNVPLNKKLEVTDDTRIKNSLETINYIIKNGGSCVLMTHLGRPKGNGYEKKLSIENIIPNIEKITNKKINLINTFNNIDLDIKSGSISILENLRFNKEEKLGDESFSKELSSLGDIFVNDAFGTTHRKHSSTYTIAKYFNEKCIGKLIEIELYNIKKILKSKIKPFTAILGGYKVSEKIGVIEKLINKVNHIIIGGAMANTFIKAKGGNIGSSVYENDKIKIALKLLKKAIKNNVEIHLPLDCIIAKEIKKGTELEVSPSNSIKNNMMNLDIGPKSLASFEKIIKNSKKILWNGPMGVFEIDEFSNGTNKIAELVSNVTLKGSFTLVGGGDSVAAINKNKINKNISFISTGGGALLDYISNENLPAIEVLKY